MAILEDVSLLISRILPLARGKSFESSLPGSFYSGRVAGDIEITEVSQGITAPASDGVPEASQKHS